MKATQSTLIYVHVRRELVEADAPLADLVEDVNEKVRRHGGIILANRQFLRNPLSPDWGLDPYLDDDTTSPFEQPLREWGKRQRHFIWTTDAWDEVSWVINLYASGSREEIGDYERSFPQADDLIAAGWQQIPSPPPASSQLSGDGYVVDIGENSAAAFKIAAAAFARSRTDPTALREAVLSAFQATELILKMRLEAIDPKAIKANNPTVIERLVQGNVAIDAQNQATIAELRRLRNKLQHGEATFGYRSTRRLLRSTFAFLDRFTLGELDYWIGHVCGREGWTALLQLPSIQENADRVSREIAARAQNDPSVEVKSCDACERETVIMFNAAVGHCLYCRWEPTIPPNDAD